MGEGRRLVRLAEIACSGSSGLEDFLRTVDTNGHV
jgi:hypothetical protein